MPCHEMPIRFAGECMILNASGVLFWPAQSLLVVSDLHLEKGSFLARAGHMLPAYDSFDTLQRLTELIQHYQPEQVMSLGDSFHDRNAYDRLAPNTKEQLHALVQSVQQWHWVLGNHDPALPQALPGKTSIKITMDTITFMHENAPLNQPLIIGHYHPKLRQKIAGHSRVSGRCFLVSHDRMIMPAFGSYTGGLEATHPEIQTLSHTPFTPYMMYREKLYRFEPLACELS